MASRSFIFSDFYRVGSEYLGTTNYVARTYIGVGSNVPPDMKQNVFFFLKKKKLFFEISEDDIFATIWNYK